MAENHPVVRALLHRFTGDHNDLFLASDPTWQSLEADRGATSPNVHANKIILSVEIADVVRHV